MIYNAPRMSWPKLLWIPLLVGCASAPVTIPAAWMSVPEAPRLRALQVAEDGTVRTVAVAVPAPHPTIRVVGNRLMNGDKAITDPMQVIQSFAVSETRGEVVFSARQNVGGDFDIGLVSTDGSPISWIPNDPADELDVAWAPRGNKISYTIRTKQGDYVRSVHVPTAFQLTNDFPDGRVRALAWDAAGERYAVSVESAVASERVETMRFGGESRRTVVPSAVTVPMTVEPFPNGLLLRPNAVRYGEKLPLVVWITTDRNAWDDARAALLQRTRVACIISERPADSAFWEEVTKRPWIDGEKAYVVFSDAEASAAFAAGAPSWSQAELRRPWIIAGLPRIERGRYEMQDRSVFVAPSVVKSFAAGFIADQLKGSSPPDGSSR